MKTEGIFRGLLVAASIAAMIFQFTIGVKAAPGDLDLLFGIGGRVTTTTGYGEKGNALAIQPDGKIVVAGGRDVSGKSLLVRYDVDGSLDQTFGSSGIVTSSGAGGGSTYTSVAIQADGKIVAAGFYYENGGCSRYQSSVARYNANGTDDTTFGGGDGRTAYPYKYVNGCPVDSYNYGLALQDDGKSLSRCLENASANLDFAAARFNIDGTPDMSFNLDGLATFSIGTSTDVANAVRVQAGTGKIILAGYSYNSATSNDFALVMLNSNGLYDLNFGNFGKVTTDTGWDDRAYAVAFAGTKVVAAGKQSNGATGVDFSLVRYSANGTPDITFDGDGKVKTAFGAYYDIAFGIALQADGKAVSAGYGRSWSDTSDNFALSRYNANGSLDTAFNFYGKQTTDFGGYADYGSAVAIQSDGKILVAGYTWNGMDYDVALARYLP